MYNYLSYLSNKRVKEFETLFNNRLEENKIPSLSVKNSKSIKKSVLLPRFIGKKLQTKITQSTQKKRKSGTSFCK